jgi:hypothetical protein
VDSWPYDASEIIALIPHPTDSISLDGRTHVLYNSPVAVHASSPSCIAAYPPRRVAVPFMSPPSIPFRRNLQGAAKNSIHPIGFCPASVARHVSLSSSNRLPSMLHKLHGYAQGSARSRSQSSDGGPASATSNLQ